MVPPFLLMQEEFLMRRSRVVGCAMFFIIVVFGYLLSSLFSWDLNFRQWNLFSIIVMIAAVFYALLGLKYNSNETKIELANAKSLDEEMKPLYEEIRIKTKAASIEQKYAILYQCAKMKDFAYSLNDGEVYRISQRLEYVMSEALGINTSQARKFFKKHKNGLDMEILCTIRNNVDLRDYLIFFFNIYSHVSAGTLDFNGKPSSFTKIADLCNSIEECFGLTHDEARYIILTRYNAYKE